MRFLVTCSTIGAISKKGERLHLDQPMEGLDCNHRFEVPEILGVVVRG